MEHLVMLTFLELSETGGATARRGVVEGKLRDEFVGIKHRERIVGHQVVLVAGDRRTVAIR